MARQAKSSKENYILTYYQQIVEGNTVVGKYVLAIYEYIVKGLEEKKFFYDPKKAHHVIDWIESHCFHVEGRLAPGALKLELWQKAFLSVMFGIVDQNGLRQFREYFLVMGRKNGKSLLLAAIERYVWQNEGFGTKCFNIAPKLEQADIIYSNIWMMTQLDPEWKAKKEYIEEERKRTHRKMEDESMARKRVGDLYIPSMNSSVKKIAFSAKKSDGFNPSIAVCDEVASWEPATGLKQYEVLKSANGAREQPIMISISTAGYIDDGIYDELMKRSTRFLSGESNEKRLLPVIYMIDDVEKWNDINELQKSNPNLGVSISVDYLLEEMAVAEMSLSKKAEFLTKYCNIKQNQSVAWLNYQTVEKTFCDPLDLNDFRGCYAVMGIDLSQTTDLTAAVLLIEKGGKIYTFARFYLPKEKIEEAIERDGVPYKIYIQRRLLFESGDNFIDYKDVYDWCKELIEQYQIYVLKVGYDRYSSQYLVQELKEYGFQTDDVYQGENLTPVIAQMEGEMKDGSILIGDNDLLKIHFLNSALKRNSETNRVKLVKISQNAHIDGTAAMLCAMCMRQKYYAEIGRQLQNERR